MVALDDGIPGTPPKLIKARTGISGLDEITGGGLPLGRPSLLCGGPGCGKTVLAMDFLLHGAKEEGEPAVFVSFEETPKDLAMNFASFGYDLPALVGQKKLIIEFVRVERSEIEEAGEYDLEGLFIRLGHAIDSIGAKRIVMDTLESLFSGFSNTAILRAELRRLFRFLKDKGVTAIITAERGEKTLTRFGLEEYVADCVIMLDHRVDEQLAIRRLRVVKYRGSAHSTSEFPFLIDEGGISILPITSVGLRHAASLEYISSGIPDLDAMLEGKGFYVGSSILVSGTAGTGKSSMAAQMMVAGAKRNQRGLWFAFEESPAQIIRNMRSIGLDLAGEAERGMIHIQSDRPSMYGLETHLVAIHKLVNNFKPQLVVIDPITNFSALGNFQEIKSMVIRLLDFLKSHQITSVFTSLTTSGKSLEHTDVGMSSLMDTWVMLQDMQQGEERNRLLYLLKSRGMAHSNKVREMQLSSQGVKLVPVYLGPSNLPLTGSMRTIQQTRDHEESVALLQQVKARRENLTRKAAALQAHIASLQADFDVEQALAENMINHVLDQSRGSERDSLQIKEFRDTSYAAERFESENGEPHGPG